MTLNVKQGLLFFVPPPPTLSGAVSSVLCVGFFQRISGFCFRIVWSKLSELKAETKKPAFE